MNILFAGTPEFAASALKALIQQGHSIPLVLTQPDRPAGRGMSLKPSAVKQAALAAGLPVFQPESLRTPEALAELTRVVAEHQIEVMVVVAYGLILPQSVLDLPRHGCLNIHASLLPRWRGAAPIHRAIEAGDNETGVGIMQMEAGLDTGPVVLEQRLAITLQDTTATLHDRLAQLGAELIVSALKQRDQLIPRPQSEHGITYAHKIEKNEAALDWSLSATQLHQKIRAFNPFPGATLTWNGHTIKAWAADIGPEPPASAPLPPPGSVLSADASGVVIRCGSGTLKITELQKAGGKRLPAAQFLAGTPLKTGDLLQGLPETNV